ncbi:unnamed protein product [Mycena citricolor]|uniref:DUF221-domain-containing protein n=1 Tax=Mycena citricolor TaxID=2018698 RepID=A0AAD2HZI1_9AGAR|nr:unnamed protein product [Mycena citricolor]
MGDIQTRPFSKDYSGLVNQSVIAAVITVLAVTGQELMKRARRGKKYDVDSLGSRESWEFGYLFQGRSWARYPSPASPRGWLLSWVKQIVWLPPEKMNELRGVDATLYVRFLRACCALVRRPAHGHYVPHLVSNPRRILGRYYLQEINDTSVHNIAGGVSQWLVPSLDPHHPSFLAHVHMDGGLLWICHGAFKLRADKIAITAKRLADFDFADTATYRHPISQYAFTDVPVQDSHHPNFGLRLRTIMVQNVPAALRDEKVLQEYLEYYMSRKLEKPSIPLTGAAQPGFINKSIAFLFNKAKRMPVPLIPLAARQETIEKSEGGAPLIERVVICRRMTELSSLLERREEILRLLETAHLRLAQKTVLAVQHAIARRDAHKPIGMDKPKRPLGDLERGKAIEDEGLSEEQRMQQLIDVIGPFVDEFGLRPDSNRAHASFSKRDFRRLRAEASQDSDIDTSEGGNPAVRRHAQGQTIWDALLTLPRSSLDAYQPLVHLSHLFRGKIVPSIDYYTAKFNLLSSFITENRAKSLADYDPVSTAFVTFADPEDARRACKYLAVHPNNPLTCLITMAPAYQDIDWIRVMKSSYNGEFVKDWVVNMGVWTFTIFWIFPVSLLVGLVSIQNISSFWPTLKNYLDRHPWEEDVIQSFVPTLLVSLLALSIPPILLLIAKKAHTLTTMSALHDLIMTRYYKFLVVNVLVFFCVGTAALQSVLDSITAHKHSSVNILNIVANSFPTAGPFYVDWLPTHLLVIHVLMLFMVLNPTVIPFGAIYFFVETGVVKNQLIHVYAKNYENNGQVLLIRMVRYSLDGLLLAQVVFLIYMVVLKKEVNVGLAAFLIVFTAFAKLLMTRIIRAQFEHDDIYEAQMLVPNAREPENEPLSPDNDNNDNLITEERVKSGGGGVFSMRIPGWVNASYATIRQHRPMQPHAPNPFGPVLVTRDKERKTVVKAESSDDSRLVVPHPPRAPWDDDGTLDLPYDNPYYTRPISNALWLPQNPFGPVDLDATFDLRVALTVDLSGGNLGSWTQQPAPQPAPPPPQSVTCEEEVTPSDSEPDGSEEINLPLIIAKRAQARDDVEETWQLPRRPSTFGRRSTISTRSRRPSLVPRVSLRSASEGVRERSGSLLSTLPSPTMTRMQSLDCEVRPDVHAQGEFVLAHASGSGLSVPVTLSRQQRSTNVTAQTAIAHEVMVEEEIALADRLEEEEEEAEKASKPRSWFTSWMFTKGTHPNSPPPPEPSSTP